MTTEEPAPALSEAEFDAQIARAGLQLTPTERSNILTVARALQRAAALVKAYNINSERADH